MSAPTRASTVAPWASEAPGTSLDWIGKRAARSGITNRRNRQEENREKIKQISAIGAQERGAPSEQDQ